ncbi:MAG: protein BatD, partial [Bacteroidaceae bacterium]
KKNQKNDFYDEVLRAMWGYVGDKLTISTANLNKDSIEDTLRAQKIPDEIVNALLHVLNDCEFARYAPGDESEVMDKVYSAAIQLISEMENLIKR